MTRPHTHDYLGLATAAIIAGATLSFIAWRTDDTTMAWIGIAAWVTGAVGFVVVAAWRRDR